MGNSVSSRRTGSADSTVARPAVSRRYASRTAAIAMVLCGLGPMLTPAQAEPPAPLRLASAITGPLATPPQLHVRLGALRDSSPGKFTPAVRKRHTQQTQRAFLQSLKRSPHIALDKHAALRLGLPTRQVDVAVTRLDTKTSGALLEVEAQLRLAVSDQQGKMLALLSGGAKVQVPRARFNMAYLPKLQQQALENAADSMATKLVTHLRTRPTS